MPCFSEFESTEELIEAWEADDDCWEFTDLERRILAWANIGAKFWNATVEVHEVAADMERRRLVKVKRDDQGMIWFTETAAGARAAHRAFMSPKEIANHHARQSRYKDEALF